METLTVERYYWDNGNIYCEVYRNKKGELHNSHGPAFRKWGENGDYYLEFYYLNGEWTSKEEWQQSERNNCDGKTVYIDGKKYKLEF